jgi:hypothetical protein
MQGRRRAAGGHDEDGHAAQKIAKDHLKAIFRKTGTHSRPELTKCLTGHL